MTRQAAERGGRRAETIAAWWLRLKGYAILARRVRTPLGEVDLVVRRGRTVAFVEVKARASEADAANALDHHRLRLRRVAAAAGALAHRYAREGDDVRVDAVFIVPGKWPRHVENVWFG
jgi:putative endonuclease